MKVLLAGGGTGGHIMPTLEVANALKASAPGVELLYVGSTKPADRELVEAAGLPFRAISTGKLRRYFSVENVGDFFRFLGGVWQAGRILREFKPDVVFAKGGYVSLPVVLAARPLRIPVVLHESDSRLGLANRLGLTAATKVAVAFPAEEYIRANPKLFRYQPRMVYVGLPVSRKLLQPTDDAKLFDNDRPVVLITGGSQGARAINQAVWSVLPELLTRYNLVHQVGRNGLNEAITHQAGLPDTLRTNYLIFDFSRELLVQAMRQADLIVGRAGSSIFEFQVLGKPAILIPLPSPVGDDHQRRNAQFLTTRQAAVSLDQRDLTGTSLLALIEQILADQGLKENLAKNMRALGTINETAAAKLADLILGLGGK